MAALDFPSSPTPGQTYTANGKTYTYDSVTGSWLATNVVTVPISTGVSGLGTGVATALGVNVGSAGAPVVNGEALGTPSSGTLTNATGLPIVDGTTGTLTAARGGTGLTSLGTGVPTALGNATNAASGIVVANSSGNIVSPGTIADSVSVIRPLIFATSVASTSGTSIDFTSIPSWVKKITVVLSGISTSGSSNPQIQIGSGTFTTSGYLSYSSGSGTASTSSSSSTTGFVIFGTSAANKSYMALTILNITGNSWVSSLSGGTENAGNAFGVTGGGSVSLGGTLDRVRITTVNGTDTFDAGTVNISYE